MHLSAFCACCRAVDTAARHHSSSHSCLLSLSPSQDLRLVQPMGILDAVCRLVGFGPFPQLLRDSPSQPPHKLDSAAALHSMRGSPGWHHLSDVRHTSSADSSCHDSRYHCLLDTVCPASKEGLHSSWRVSDVRTAARVVCAQTACDATVGWRQLPMPVAIVQPVQLHCLGNGVAGRCSSWHLMVAP